MVEEKVFWLMWMPSILNSIFSKIIWINLERRVDRRREMDLQLANLGISAVRLSAVDGNPSGYTPGLLREEVGCILSHMEVLLMAKASLWESILILEDDAVLDPSIDFLFSEYTRELPEDWDVLMLSGNHNFAANGLMSAPFKKHLMRCNATLTTAAYAVKSKAYDNLTGRIARMDKALDLMYVDIQPTLRWFCTRPNLVKQRAGFSDIQKKFVDYSDCIV